jgi:hypothetical protein
VCVFVRPGITLVEAAFALVVVGLAAVAVLTAVGAELRTAEHAQRGLEAAALAEHRLARIRPLPHHELRPLGDSLARGYFEPPFERYRWEASVTPVRGESDLLDLTVRIHWDSGRYQVHTRVFRPAQGTVWP